LFPMIQSMNRGSAEHSLTPFTLSEGQSRIGRQMFDPRVTIDTDPMDPVGGYMPFDAQGLPRQAVRWVDRGILLDLPYDKYYAISQLGLDRALSNPMAYRMGGGPVSIDQMIASTWRGILITRFNGVNIIDGPTLQCTGTTRDGTWVIENG